MLLVLEFVLQTCLSFEMIPFQSQLRAQSYIPHRKHQVLVHICLKNCFFQPFLSSHLTKDVLGLYRNTQALESQDLTLIFQKFVAQLCILSGCPSLIQDQLHHNALGLALIRNSQLISIILQIHTLVLLKMAQNMYTLPAQEHQSFPSHHFFEHYQFQLQFSQVSRLHYMILVLAMDLQLCVNHTLLPL